jgi:hypothetical protein
MTLGRDNNAGDRRDVADEIEFFVERSVDGIGRIDQEQRASVRAPARPLLHRLGSELINFAAQGSRS